MTRIMYVLGALDCDLLLSGGLTPTLSMMVSSTLRMDVLASPSRGANCRITGRHRLSATMIIMSARMRRSLLVAECNAILLMLTESS